jgi:hypothetical protein
MGRAHRALTVVSVLCSFGGQGVNGTTKMHAVPVGTNRWDLEATETEQLEEQQEQRLERMEEKAGAEVNVCSLKPGPICEKKTTEQAATQLQPLFGNQLFNTRCEWGEIASGSSVADKLQTNSYYPSSAFLTKERAVANQRKRLLRRLIGSTLCAPGIPDKAHNSFGDIDDSTSPIGENHFEILADDSRLLYRTNAQDCSWRLGKYATQWNTRL